MLALRLFLLIFIISIVKCDVGKRIRQEPISGRGSRGIEPSIMKMDKNIPLKIDKNTVITRNMKLHTRKREEKNTQQQASRDRDRDPEISYHPFPQEVEYHAEQFKKNMTECLREVQALDRRSMKRLSPKSESPVHGECLIACVLKRNGVIVKGKIYKGNLIELLEKFFAKDIRLMKKMERHLDRCIAIASNARDECTMASQLNDCTNDLMAHSKRRVNVNY